MTTEEIYLLVKGCAENNRKHQEYFYKHFYPSMMRLVRRYIDCPFLAEEIMNNGFLRIFKQIHKFEYKGSLEGWMRKIMFHAVADAVKNDKRILTKEKREKGFFKIVALERKTSWDTLETVEIPHYDNDNLSCEDIYSHIEKLPKTTADVFKLFLNGFKHNEISEMLSMAEGTSKWHVSNAREFLKKTITL